ncbi:HAMP domain-containing histidine kinase [Brevibacillus sp. M2.1A]|uniref:sensor histidine kinase n=1 Tax=Brevibacillus TaxID=55080 RepID=UPI00156B5D08|nr:MULTISPECIES: HAMP domain-containing sensor histidine kinase [Brevibacillus]MBY0086146.1 HAMP domain-containing histidine kinase [Brevibacillus brevis]MCC8438159.1 HAMP domain-containing histidine kinase [Brevibacillus sp. M2.1A]
MLKNKEIRKLCMYSMFISFIGITILWMIDWKAGIVGVAMVFLLLSIFFLFTRKRYQDIRKLAYYLASVYSGQPTMDIRDNVEGELSILKNDIYKVTLTLSEQSTLLKKEKQYLADTLSNISHQLKTPLTSMFVMADLLNNPSLPPDKREEFLGKIINQLKRIEWLVTSLLKLSKIEVQSVIFKKELVSVKKMINKAVEPLLVPMELKNQELSFSCKEDLFVYGDENWTVEAILNVIKNGIEHTPVGGQIAISCEETPLYTQIVIADSGEGISPEDAPHIFERFYKGKNAGADSIGIGLAMSKTILQSQNADVFMESQIGAGTTFRIKFYKQII